MFAPCRTRKRAASVGLQHTRMNVSAGLSDACATPSFLLRMFPCGILVPDPATLHRGWCCWDCACVAETHTCMFIHTRMHANSDIEKVTRMHGLHDGEIRFTLMNIVLKQS